MYAPQINDSLFALCFSSLLHPLFFFQLKSNHLQLPQLLDWVSSSWPIIFWSFFSFHLSFGFFTVLTVLLSTIDLLTMWMSLWLCFSSVQIIFYEFLWENTSSHSFSDCSLTTTIFVMAIWHLEDMEVDDDLLRPKGQLYGANSISEISYLIFLFRKMMAGALPASE